MLSLYIHTICVYFEFPLKLKMLTSCYVTLFVVLMISLSNASIDVFIHTEVSLAVHYKCVPGEAFFGEFGSTHKFSVEPSKDSVCHVVWNNLEGTFVALEGAYDRNHNPVYWSVRHDGFYHSWDNQTYVKKETWSK